MRHKATNEKKNRKHKGDKSRQLSFIDRRIAWNSHWISCLKLYLSLTSNSTSKWFYRKALRIWCTPRWKHPRPRSSQHKRVQTDWPSQHEVGHAWYSHWYVDLSPIELGMNPTDANIGKFERQIHHATISQKREWGPDRLKSINVFSAWVNRTSS